MNFKKLFVAFFVVGIICSMFLTNTFTASATENTSALQQIELQWMRSGELESDKFVVPMKAGDDAWNYNQVCDATSLRYFETSSAQFLANAKAAEGTENVSEDGQLVGTNFVWDCGDFYNKYREENGNVSYAWASWKHWGIDSDSKGGNNEYSLRRYTSYFDLNDSLLSGLQSATLAPADELGAMSYLFTINDTVFVFVNGNLVYWGGTDITEGNNQYGALVRSSFGGV